MNTHKKGLKVCYIVLINISDQKTSIKEPEKLRAKVFGEIFVHFCDNETLFNIIILILLWFFCCSKKKNKKLKNDTQLFVNFWLHFWEKAFYWHRSTMKCLKTKKNMIHIFLYFCIIKLDAQNQFQNIFIFSFHLCIISLLFNSMWRKQHTYTGTHP